MHGLIFETSICYWQDQPDCYPSERACACGVHACARLSRITRFCLFVNWIRNNPTKRLAYRLGNRAPPRFLGAELLARSRFVYYLSNFSSGMAPAKRLQRENNPLERIALGSHSLRRRLGSREPAIVALLIETRIAHWTPLVPAYTSRIVGQYPHRYRYNNSH